MKTFSITQLQHAPSGVVVTIDGFGPWGLTHDDVRLLRDGDHLVRGTWPVGEEFCTDDWCQTADERVAELLDAQQEAARFEAIEQQTRTYPGAPVEVWGGWVWMIGFSDEQRWPKRPTYRECIEAVYETVERLGIDEAFDLCPHVDDEEIIE